MTNTSDWAAMISSLLHQCSQVIMQRTEARHTRTVLIQLNHLTPCWEAQRHTHTHTHTSAQRHMAICQLWQWVNSRQQNNRTSTLPCGADPPFTSLKIKTELTAWHLLLCIKCGSSKGSGLCNWSQSADSSRVVWRCLAMFWRLAVLL